MIDMTNDLVAALPTHTFSLGSIVKLKSGGIDMTVVGLGDDLSPNVEVAWQDESGVLQRSWLPAASLTLSLKRQLSECQKMGIVWQVQEDLRRPCNNLDEWFQYEANCWVESERRIALAESGQWDMTIPFSQTPFATSQEVG